MADEVSGRYLDFDYDGQGRLTSVADHTGRMVQYGYDANDNLAVVTDTRGLTWTYSYTTAGGGAGTPHYLHTIVDPTGRTIEKTFFDSQGRATLQEDGLGRVMAQINYLTTNTRVVTESGQVMTNTYDVQGLLRGQTDTLGQRQFYDFDPFFNRNRVEDANGNPTSYHRTDLGLTRAITDALGRTTVFTYDLSTNNLTAATDARGHTINYTYQGNNLRSVTTVSGTVVYTYNSRGQVIEMRDENGQPAFYGYNSVGDRTVITNALSYSTRYEYDSLGRVVTTTDALGKVTLNEYDNADNLIKVTENYTSNLAAPANEYNLVTTYTYDGANRLLTTTDPEGRVTRNVYDNAGQLLQTIQNEHPTVTTQNYQDEYNLVTTYGYDQVGRQVVVTDTLNRATRTEYDELNRVERTIVNYVDGVYSSAQPDEDIITRYEYDPQGNLVSTFDTLGRETRNEYDDLNRVERTIVNYQNGVYDPAKPDEDLISRYTYDEAGNQKTMIDPLGRQTTYVYDALNRVERITNPLNGLTRYTYDPAGNRLSMTDAENRTTTYSYDALNRVVTTTNALSGTTTVAYDPVGNQVSLTDARGHPITFTYDTLYRLIRTTDAKNQVTRYTYDVLGNRLSVTDPETNTTTFAYDSLNRVVTTTNPLSGTALVTYDALGNRLSLTDANNHTTTYTYDDLNRLVESLDPNSLTTTLTYDGLGNRLSLTNDADETTEFEYDQANRLVLMRDPLGHETEYRYDGAGNRIAMIDAEAVETRYGYDALNRLTSVIENYVDGVYSASRPDEDVKTTYDYDAVGNRETVTDANNHTTTYGYDALNRLVEMSDPLPNTTQYGYDAVGNRTVITDANGAVTAFIYDEVNRLTDIDYPAGTPDVTFTYDKAGNRQTMSDGTGTTTYVYDDLYRLTEMTDGHNQAVDYSYDPVGNRTHLIYPNNQVVTYTYDLGNRLETVTDWHNGQFGYNYDEANRLTGLSLPNDVESSYTYDQAGRLTLLTHATNSDTLASYAYRLDRVGNRTTLTETIAALLTVPSGAYLEDNGLVVMEAEHFSQRTNGTSHTWLLKTGQPGYTGTSYLQALPDRETLSSSGVLTTSPVVSYPINFTTPGTYTLWLRGSGANAGGDSVYINLGEQSISLTGFDPTSWSWARQQVSQAANELTATLVVSTTGVHTLSLRLREDGVRVDRLLLTTGTTYLPTGAGPAETARQSGSGQLDLTIDRVITYDYDDLYRLIEARYTPTEASTGAAEVYEYEYDPVGNRLQQIINGDTTDYLYDAANRLTSVDGQSYTFDDNGNLLNTGVMTNTFDTANRLIESERDGYTLEPLYNGIGDRVAQTTTVTTTYFALDVIGLPEVIYTSEGNSYLHLPGVIVAESAEGEVRYLLSDGLGSIRQAVDENAEVVSYDEYDPYGNPLTQHATRITPYGYTGEWWQEEVGLLHLRARWYLAEVGTFVSRDAVEGEPPYAYVRGNPINRIDPSGYNPQEGEVGTNYVYSCNCGWIDWHHAQPAKIPEKVWEASNQATASWVRIPVKGFSDLVGGIDGNVLFYTGLSVEDQKAAALGIFLSGSNLFEAYQGGYFNRGRGLINDIQTEPFDIPFFPIPLTTVVVRVPAIDIHSAFSEEDLISDLIGFHRGIMQSGYYKNPYSRDDTQKWFEKECKVVGWKLRQSGHQQEFEALQKQIYADYIKAGGFVDNRVWGQARLGAWQGSEDEGCNTPLCKDPRLPSILTSIQPLGPSRPGFAHASWFWESAQVHFMGITTHRLSSNFLNQVPLNWLKWEGDLQERGESNISWPTMQ